MDTRTGGPSPVDLYRIFAAGQLVSIEVAGTRDPLANRSLHQSRVEEVYSDAVVLTTPRVEDKPVRFANGTELKVHLIRLGVRFTIHGDVAGIPAPGRLQLQRMRDLHRNDARSYVRVETLLEPVKFEVRDMPRLTPAVMVPRVVDISLGGIAMVCTNAIPLGSIVHVMLDLPKADGPVKFEGEVLRVHEPPENRLGRFRMGLQYVDISQRDRDRIAGYVLYQQQVQKRKGLL